MLRKRMDNGVERRLITGMVTSTEFLSQVSPVIEIDLISASHFQIVARWCVDYFDEYREAPNREIETIFHAWSDTHANEAEVDAVHKLLEQLSDSYDDDDPLNVPYLIDQLRLYLERKSLERLRDNMEHSLQIGGTDEASQHVTNYKPIEVSSGWGINPLTDMDAWERAFADTEAPLLSLPGDAGRFLNHALVRDGLIGIQAPEKRGKTFWCIEFVARALESRRKVAFFQVGDLSLSQVLLRLGMYWSGRPSKPELCGWIDVPEKINKPSGPQDQCSADDDEESTGSQLTVETKRIHIPHALTMGAARKACQKLMKSKGLNPEKTYIKVSVHPNSSINVKGIEAVLARWEMSEDFIPDVIVIDYADILAAEDPQENTRDQVNTTWKALRRLSQERHCLVIVPTQADAASYDQRTQTMHNFSEDKRKLAHVTGMLGLNQTPEEKDVNVMRLNWIVLRENPFNAQHCLYVGQCLAIGRALWCATL